MIQELLGGSGLLSGGGQTQFSFNGTGTILEGSHSSSSSLSPSPSPSITPTKGSCTNSSDPQQNLRCPRCNSLNTKFCYYNNYNLTQPRHFCKTCRRYWTKGGALRNIPIGGGCRKNKSNTIFSTTTTISGCAKSSTSAERVLRGCLSSHDSGKSDMRNGFNHQSYNNPIVWPSSASSHNSQLLSLLGASPRNANPNSCLDMKTEESCMINGSSEVDMNSRVVSNILDHVVSSSQQVPFGLCSNSTTSSFLKNNNQEHSGLLFDGDHQVSNTGIQELYQRIRSSSANYYSTSHDHTVQPSTDGLNDVTNSTSTMSILESAPVTNGEGNMGFFNIPQFSWSDQLTTTTTGAFP